MPVWRSPGFRRCRHIAVRRFGPSGAGMV